MEGARSDLINVVRAPFPKLHRQLNRPSRALLDAKLTEAGRAPGKHLVRSGDRKRVIQAKKDLFDWNIGKEVHLDG